MPSHLQYILFFTKFQIFLIRILFKFFFIFIHTHDYFIELYLEVNFDS